MSQVNQSPTGLQSFLGAQNFGVNPNNLAQTVSPVVELTPFLGSGQQRYARATAALNGKGVATSLTIPAGEAWYLLSLSGGTPSAINAGPFKLQLGMTNLPGFNPGLQHNLASDARISYLAGEGVVVDWQPARPSIFEPGTVFVLRALSAPGLGNETYEITARFYRLTV